MTTRRPLSCPHALLTHLRQGDVLARSLAEGWRLIRADCAVTEDAVDVLLLGGFVMEDGGGLAPAGDCLPGFEPHLSQTWRWAEARSAARH